MDELTGPRIRILEDSIANKIAAGEVVERPASVVKELIENAIDAEATRINLEVEQGGRRLLRVADNGSGMTAEEVVLALQRHATSKIHDERDLYAIKTLGFRGEAMPSIAAVSKMTITTAIAGADSGTRLVCHGGSIEELTDVGAPQGTDVQITDLFYNTPARYKFLRSPTTELHHISNLMLGFSISHHHISFRQKSEGREVFTAPATTRLEDSVLRAFPHEGLHLVSVTSQVEGVSLRGMTSLPHSSRSTRTGQLVFVNGRNVRSRAISQGIVAAYQTYLKRDEFPICILVLEIDPRIVDVNVHPAKAEVKFADERGVVKFVVEALRGALGGSHDLMRVTATSTSEGVTYAPPPVPDGPGYRPSVAGSVGGPAGAGYGSAGASPSQAQAPLQDLDVGLPSSHDATIGGLVPLVQTQGAWVICDSPDGIVLVDPHAAHERVLYEEFLARTRPVNSQRLVAPETVNLGRIEADAVKESLDILASIGFDVEEFGPNTFLIRSAPAESGRRSTVNLFDEVVHELVGIALQEPSVRPGPDVRIARCACKMAVKVGDPLSHAEIVEILSRLSRVENAYTCPHGRPTMFTITNEFIEQKFRRR